MPRRTRKQAYEELSWWKKATYDSLSIQKNHWDEAAKIADGTLTKSLFRQYSKDVKAEMDLVLNW